MLRLIPVLFVLVFASACSPKLQVRPATPGDIILRPKEPHTDKISPCYAPLSYVAHPELMRMKYIRVNLHFINSTDGRYTIPKNEVSEYAYEMIKVVNSNLENNMKMFLPRGNDTPLLPIPYRYVITGDPNVPGDDGVYYHVDDTLCYAVKTGRERNISDKRLIKKYAVRDDSVMNIFLQTHHLDSIKSKTYRPDGSGISLGSSVKIFGRWFEKPSPWNVRGITNHEIGHSLGLSHTWGGHDGCDDTPPHPNCWNVSDTPPCDSMYSNNMMDYNAHMAALTPCQIGKILANMTRLDAMQRNILEPRWCHVDTSATVTITDSVRWNGSVDHEGHIIIRDGGLLEISCRVSMPKESFIRIYPGGRLVVRGSGRIHNSCGDTWTGIELVHEKKSIGKVEVIEGGLIEDTSIPLLKTGT